MTTAEDTRYAATMEWIEQVVADSPVLRASSHEYFTLSGQLWVRVAGAHFETLAWHHAVGGLIQPDHVDGHGVRRQMIFGIRVHVEVVDDPRAPKPQQVKGGGPDDAAWLGLVERGTLAGGKGAATGPSPADAGSIRTGLAFIVTLVGLFFWGWTHSSRSPNGATLLAIAILGTAVLLVSLGISIWRRADHQAAAYTERIQPGIRQDTSGEHYQDGA